MGKGDLKLEIRGNVDFLTDFPQISFFDAVYKRYTNFSTETNYLPMSGALEFGETLTCILPKYGDLIHKMYFAVTLSGVSIPRKTPINGLSKDIEISNYNSFLTFLNLLYPVYRNIVDEQTNINFNISDIQTIIETVLINKAYTDIKTSPIYDLIYGSHYDFINEYDQLTNKTNAFDPITGKLNLVTFVNFVSLTELYDNKLFLLTKKFNTVTNYYFSWKKKIGHLLLQQIDLEIGGQKIDRQYTDWLNIWQELTIDNNILPTYKKMIGDIDILTTYDANAKPQYQLLIPLQFFFNRYLECALPIIFFRYHEVKISIQVNNLYNIINIDPAFVKSGLDIDNYVSILDARLLTEYIYLDEDERVKFATYAHEYLIDYVQEYNTEITSQQQTINFDFFNSVKSMYFTIQSNQSLHYLNYSYNTNIMVEGKIENDININAPVFIVSDKFIDQFIIDSSLIGKKITLTNSNYYNNTYTIVAVTPGNNQFQFDGKYEGSDNAILTYNLTGPLDTFELFFESYPRQKKIEGEYLNYIIPYKCHTVIPNEGIYTYTFSLSPENYQPSGACNYSALRYKSINLSLKDNFWNYANQYNPTEINKATFKMYGLTYNILRLANGMGALYFSS